MITESRLDTHDLTIPIRPSPVLDVDSTHANRQLRVLLLSPTSTSDVNLSDTLDRIHHFGSLTGGRDLVIIFLLNPPKTLTFISTKGLTDTNTTYETNSDGVLAYAKIQATLHERQDIPHVPILPLAAVESLPQLLKKHLAAISHNPIPTKPVASSFEMLQLCTTEAPMDRQTAYFATDCFSNLRELALACAQPDMEIGSSSPSHERASSGMLFDGNGAYGSKMMNMQSLVGPEKCKELVDFWAAEWVVD